MSTTSAVYSSASLKAANALPYISMEGRLDPLLLEALKDMNFEFMTPVQSRVLTGLPSLKHDCVVQAKTGTGKTTAFLLPAIQNMIQNSPSKEQVAILIISPTRELALQISAEASRLVAKLKPPVQVHTAYGGTAKATSLRSFVKSNPKILVATPGRLNDYLSEEEVRARFRGMKTLILDEADRMLDAGFLPDILKVLRALPPKHGPNGQWQGMCFSATIPPKMQEVLSYVLNKDHVSISTTDASEPPTVEKVPQYSIVIPKVQDTFSSLLSLIKKEIEITKVESKIIVFGTTANLVALYSEVFQNLTPFETYELQSRMSQAARTKATNAFKVARNGILFATDVVGRGMDFPDVSLVVQVGLPTDADAYTHRVGRTARAGKSGRAIILLTQAESFFLRVHRQFPMQPHPETENILKDTESATQISIALQKVEPKEKQRAYSAYLGFMKGHLNKLQMNATELVRMANDFAMKGMACDELPEMEKKTVGKMGMKGVPGIRLAKPAPSNPDIHKKVAPAWERAANDSAPSRRLRHQGAPEPNSSVENNASRVAENRREGQAVNRGNLGMREGRGGNRGSGLHPGTIAKRKQREEAAQVRTTHQNL